MDYDLLPPQNGGSKTVLLPRRYRARPRSWDSEEENGNESVTESVFCGNMAGNPGNRLCRATPAPDLGEVESPCPGVTV